MNPTALWRRTFITACMLTRTTELAARQLGASFFLPALFVRRYAEMGGLDQAVFTRQLSEVRSFKDEAWCPYWNDLAEAELTLAEEAVKGIARVAPTEAGTPGPEQQRNVAGLRDLLGRAGPAIVALLTGEGTTANVSAPAGPPAEPIERAVTGLRHLVKAITYYQVSAFPGGSPARLEAYRSSRRLFDRLLEIVGTPLDVSIERRQIAVEDEVVDGYLILPAGDQACPVVIVTNGLEGTVQELVLPLIRYRHSGLAVFVMEMPGTYSYHRPLSGASEQIYHRVIDQIATHARVDSDRIGFVGVSFGGYWAARMAAASQRLRCVVACGAPTHHSFQATSSVGIPDIIVGALLKTTQARNFHQLSKQLQALSLRDTYSKISTPLLVINGENDTLLSTQDSIELAAGAANATLVLYPGDDHCAMGHYREWLDLSQAWLQNHLLGRRDRASGWGADQVTLR